MDNDKLNWYGHFRGIRLLEDVIRGRENQQIYGKSNRWQDKVLEEVTDGIETGGDRTGSYSGKIRIKAVIKEI